MRLTGGNAGLPGTWKSTSAVQSLVSTVRTIHFWSLPYGVMRRVLPCTVSRFMSPSCMSWKMPPPTSHPPAAAAAGRAARAASVTLSILRSPMSERERRVV